MFARGCGKIAFCILSVLMAFLYAVEQWHLSRQTISNTLFRLGL
jgi:hypothetical protein